VEFQSGQQVRYIWRRIAQDVGGLRLPTFCTQYTHQQKQTFQFFVHTHTFYTRASVCDIAKWVKHQIKATVLGFTQLNGRVKLSWRGAFCVRPHPQSRILSFPYLFAYSSVCEGRCDTKHIYATTTRSLAVLRISPNMNSNIHSNSNQREPTNTQRGFQSVRIFGLSHVN